jgi:ABC-type antimicrobial peptide transport system permease subunit
MSTHPFRRLWRTPAFSLAAILTLALGTGATGAVFTLVNAVLLRPLPFEAPDQVGLIWAVQPSGARTWLSFPELEDLQHATAAAAALTQQLTRVFPLASRVPLPLSPWIAGAAGIVICAIAALWIPARRASTVDPLVSLRGE